MRVSKRRVVFLVAVLAGFICLNEQLCHAQLIGNRTVGAPIASPGARQQPGTGPSNVGQGTAAPGASSIGNGNGPTVNGRFVRGNRQRSDFVGSNRTDQQGFVGATQAIGVGRVQSATDTLRIPKARTANRPVPLQPTSGMYYPKLDFEEILAIDTMDRPNEDTAGESFLEEIQTRMKRIADAEIGLEMNGRTAILRGKVDSQRTADLLSRVLQFEPGIDDVRNEMVIIKKRP